jgi:O-antigen/teichoic acid export membrane protein
MVSGSPSFLDQAGMAMMQRRITKDLLTYLPGKALPALAAFITLPIYTHLFSPAEFGNFVLATAASEFLLLGTISGFGQAAVRFFSAYKQKSALSNFYTAIFGGVGLITLLVTVTSASILFIFHSLIPPDLYPLLWDTLALFVVSAWFQTLTDLLRGQEQSRWYSITWVSQHYGGIIIGLILVLVFRMGISGLIWGMTLGLLIAIIPLIWFITRNVTIRTANFKRTDFKQLWQFAWPVTIGNIAFWSLSLADRYIVKMFHGSYEVGLYSVSNKISSRTTLLLVGLFFLAPAPTISRLWEEKGRQASEEALTTYTRIFFLMVIPAVLGLAVVAAPLVRLLADEAYFGGYTAIWLVACASMGLGLSDLGSIGCLVANQTRLIARNQCIAAVVGLILNLIMVPLYGFMGAAISAAIAFFLLAGLQAITSARILTWRWPVKTLWRVLAAAALMAGSALLVQSALPSDTIIWQAINLLLSILVGVLMYGLVLWLLGEISPQHLFVFSRADHHPEETDPSATDTEHPDPGNDRYTQ